ncbi:Orotidine 5'-phosphate decarboxylase [Frankia canadensis]|uniref:Orotidine 5'-phosphate decarboxylase n=1 Tax=Frankia canadensis TaxID=1836972 RepID=A0A2I2KRA2_9ACTN|nr:orotidine-5'-phosphate decarboxylase [Frankia canadensis]SNQ48201.1 Orotidine 5'-phosphate decarboxylase [Frankia canadensis]SOU55491.1 Orotidine 5'-phosphate decarboxylase [Frankia canadensis]
MSGAARYLPPAGRAPLAVALDAPDGATALRWAAAVAPSAAVLKIGLELFYRAGPGIVADLREAGLLDDLDLFLDLKLHDIPATVAGGMRSVATLLPRFVTVHASGGAAMIRAAIEAAPDVEVAVVTVLTSLDAAALAAVGLAGPPDDAVRRLAVLAVEAGARTLVCSPREVRMVRSELGGNVTLITPGVRPVGAEAADQARIATPGEALEAGADLVVVGRPITRAPDLGMAARAVADSISAGRGPDPG